MITDDPSLPYPLGRHCCGAADAGVCHQRGLCWMEGVHPESPGYRARQPEPEAPPLPPGPCSACRGGCTRPGATAPCCPHEGCDPSRMDDATPPCPVHDRPRPPSPWRVGQHYGIHVYEGDRPVATFHDADDAARAVDAVNRSSDARVETVARALWEDDNPALVHVYNAEQINDLWRSRPPGSRYERLAVAALAAMHPADETLRERVEALAAELAKSPGLTGRRFLADRLRAVLGGEL